MIYQKKIVFFDLDHTVIDSSHRQLTKADGSLDLDHWRKNCTFSKIMRDTVLPMAYHWRRLQNHPHVDIVVCTARVMGPDDILFLKQKNLQYRDLLSRDLGDTRPDHELKLEKILRYLTQRNIPTAHWSRFTIYDDNDSVRDILTNRLSIKAIDPRPINKRMRAL